MYTRPTKVEIAAALNTLEVAKSEGILTPADQEKIAALSGVRSEVTETLSAKPVAAENAPEATGMASFKAQYESLKPEYKAGCTWQEVETRLAANDGRYLKLAEAMEQGGVLFGVDKDGNPLIADGGVEPILKGMNYPDTRKAVMFTEVKGKQVATGYEMFPYSGDYNKSDEILAFEDSQNEPFVRSENKEEWRGSWLESGEKPGWPWLVYFLPGNGDADVGGDRPQYSGPGLGVRRLLRVKA